MEAGLNALAESQNVTEFTLWEAHRSASRFEVMTIANHTAAHRDFLEECDAGLRVYTIGTTTLGDLGGLL